MPPRITSPTGRSARIARHSSAQRGAKMRRPHPGESAENYYDAMERGRSFMDRLMRRTRALEDGTWYLDEPTNTTRR